MLSRIKRKFKSISPGVKSAIVYTFATVFTRGLAIVTTPIFTRIMSTSEIGVINLYNSWYSLISVIATLALASGGFAVAMKDFSNDRDSYQSSVVTLTTLIAVGLAAVYFVAPEKWQGYLGLPNGLIILMIIGFIFAPARDFWLARQRYEYKYKLAAIVTIIPAIVSSAISILVVVYLNRNGSSHVAEGRLYANYAIIYSVCAVIWMSIIKKGKTFYNKEFWKLSLSLSLPLVGYQIASQILNVSDRMMISKMIGNSEVGIYSTLYTVSSLSTMVWGAINSSFVPFLFQNIDDKGREKDIANVALKMLGAYAGVAILVTYLAPEIVFILATPEYYEAKMIMPPIAAGIFFIALTQMYSNIVVNYRKTKYVMYPSILAAMTNIVLNFIFIKMFGYMAAAYTTLISYMLLAISQAFLAMRISKQHGHKDGTVYNDRRMFELALLTTAIIMLGGILYSHNIVRYILVFIFILTGVLLLLKYNRNNNLKNTK